MITSPYNFVPLNKKVVYPHWAKLISHDVPFENSLSGTIELQITANTPIFVKDGMSAKEAEKYRADKIQNKPFLPNKLEDKYFIPGTSIKGMLANVLEIISFGELKNRVDDKRYAFRDLTRNGVYLNKFKAKKILCGWLKRIDDHFEIENCGEPGRISHAEIDKKFNTSFVKDFGLNFSGKDGYQKSAMFKYSKIDKNQIIKYHRFRKSMESLGRKILEFDESGELDGNVIFTGQAKKRDNNNKSGQFYEFVFPKKINDLSIDKKVMEDFFFTYYDQDENQWSFDWTIRRVELLKNNQKIPVFFSLENGKVIDLGLSYLYKLPYKYSVVETIERFQNIEEKCHDLTSCIFGYSIKSNEKLENLKGRVHFGHAFALENTAKLLSEHKKYVLGTPKASYYPNYISQDAYPNGIIKGTYNTFMHDTALISGYKRYPVREDYLQESNSTKDTDKVATIFTPLEKGAQFTCKISYHNLRPEELGALISAITFHKSKDHFHSLGMGKPFGFGRIQVDVLNIESYLPHLKKFENYMNYSLKDSNWGSSDQIKELLALSSLQSKTDEEKLVYPRLKNSETKNNDFVQAKNKGLALQRYSNMIKNQFTGFKNLEEDKESKSADYSIWEKEKEVYKELTAYNVKEKYEAKLSKKRNEITQVFEAEKKKLSEKLSAKLKELEDIQKANAAAAEEQERMAKREEARLVAETEGPALGNIPDKDRKALDSISSALQVWVRNFYKNNTLDRIIGENPNGYLLEPFRETLKNKLVEVANNGHKTQKDKLAAPFAKNPFFKKIQTWVGPDVAQQWYDDLNKTE